MADDLKRVGLVFTAEGDINFTKSLREVSASIQQNRSEFALAQSELDKHATATDKLKISQEYLTKQTKDYSDKCKMLQSQLDTLEQAENRDERAIEKKKTELNNAKTSLNNYEKGLADVNKELESGSARMKDYNDKLSSIGNKAGDVGKKLSTGVTLPIAAMGTASIAAWNQMDSAYDNIAVKTGALGESLDELQNSFDNVYGSTVFDSEAVSNAIGDINTRLDLTGEDLEESTTAFLRFAEVNNTDVSSAIESVSRYMGDASIPADQYKEVLDALTAASQKSGIEINKLAEDCTKYGAPMRALGLTTQESIAMFAQWEKAGVNTEIAFSGMKKAISTWGKEGKNSTEEFKKTLEEIQKCPDIAAATTKAIEVFGAKAGPDLADAIKGGRFSIEEMMQTIENSNGQLDSSFDATVDSIDESKIALHNAQLAGAELGETMLELVTPVIKDITSLMKSFKEKVDNMSDGQKKALVVVLAVIASIGPLLMMIKSITTAIIGLNTVITILSAHPIVLLIIAIVAAIIALVLGIKYLWENCEGFRDAIYSIGDGIKASVKAVGDTFSNIGNGIKNGINGVTNKARDAKNKVTDTLEGCVSTVRDKMNAIKNAFTDKINAAKDGVRNAIDRIKSFFHFDWSLPKIKLPHFSFEGSFNLAPPRVPHISVDWYAKGGILNSPTIFGMNGSSLMGGGEAGKEAVTPISELLNMFRQSNSELLSAVADKMENSVYAGVLKALKLLNLKVELNEDEVGEVVSELLRRKVLA